MGRINSYEYIKPVLDEAGDRFAPFFEEVPECRDILKSYCTAIDRLIDAFDGESLEIEVDEITMDISIRIEYPDMIIESKDHPFCKLVARAKSVSFSKGEGDLVSVCLVFPPIWEKV